MNEIRKYLSVVGTMALMVLAAFAVSSLMSMILSIPMSFGFSGMLAVEFGVCWFFINGRQNRVSTKMILGIVFVTVLCMALIAGLLMALPYLMAYLTDRQLGTSFPWYTGFAFAALFAGPVLLLTGASWVVLHLRERKRNIRDIRLLSVLLLIGTVVWAVLWTVDRIRLCLIHPEAYNHPWGASILFSLMYFGPWLLLEAGVLALMRFWEKKLTPEDLQAHGQKAVPAPERNQFDIRFRLSDLPVLILPMIALAVVTALFWDSGYLVYNIGVALTGAASTFLVTGIAVWVVCQKLSDPKMLVHLKWLSWLMTALTAVAMSWWYIWYQKHGVADINSLPDYAIACLSIAYFGPMLLGHGSTAVLLGRLGKRALSAPEHPQESVSAACLALVLAAVLGLNGVAAWGQLESMVYRDEIPVSVKEVTYPDSNMEGHFMVQFAPDQQVWIYDTDEELIGNGIYITATARWKPFEKIDSNGHYHNFYPDENVDKLYIYEPGEGFVLALIKDLDTGLWENCE